MRNLLDIVNDVIDEREQLIMAIGSLLQLGWNIPTNWDGAINGYEYGKCGCTKVELALVESDDAADTRIELRYYFGDSFSADLFIYDSECFQDVSTPMLKYILSSMM